MRRYRERKRKDGMRPVQLWVPDTKAPGYAAKIRRQSLLAAGSKGEQQILDWIEAIYEWPKN
jgi:hypothetical protein